MRDRHLPYARTAAAAALVLFAASAVVSAAAGAQELRLSGSAMRTSHDQLETPAGWELSVQWPLRLPLPFRLAVRGGASRIGEGREYVGSSCSGLAEPGTCQPVPLRERVRATDLSLGAAATLWNGGGVRLQLTGARHWVAATTRTRTSAGATAFGGKRDFRGRSLGGDVTLSPRMLRGAGLVLGVQRAWWTPHDIDYIADGYVPFTDRMRTTAVTLGASWRVMGR